MKVYVVSLYDEVYNVFATREAAEEAAAMNNQIYTAIREALHELRTEQDIKFKTISDEKFAIGYIAKTVILRLNKKENNSE